MTDLRKAAEMALEALERGTTGLAIRAIPALRQALAQPEQEPVAWLYNGHLHECDPSEWAITDVIPLYTAPPKRELAKPEQEFKYTPYGLRFDENGKLSIGEISQREWVGLTDDEIEDAWGNTPMMLNARDGGARRVFARAIESKLKEKNTT